MLHEEEMVSPHKKENKMPKIKKSEMSIEVFDCGKDGKATMTLKNKGEFKVLAKGKHISELCFTLKDVKDKHNIPYFTPCIRHKGVSFESRDKISASTLLPDHNSVKDIHLKSPKGFDINKRFKMVEDVIKMVLKGYQDSIVICGRGGAGKSHTLMKTMNEMGMIEVTREMEVSAELIPNSYVTVKGCTSPLELYKFIYDNRTATLVFDDCDAVFQNEATCNILKAVLDTTAIRKVTWLSPVLEREGYDKSFIFEGKIIFITNRTMDKIPDAIQSRSMLLDLDFSIEELIERMRELSNIMIPNLTEDQAKELIDFIYDKRNDLKNLSLRTLLKASKFIEAGCEDWKDLVEFSM